LGEGESVYREILVPPDGWSRLGVFPGVGFLLGFRIQVHDVTGLAPGSMYRVSLLPGVPGAVGRMSEPFTEAIFETLPARLPATDSNVEGGGRPFTILLGSCYWVHGDDGSVADRYTRLYKDPVERPHLKLLVGDQVYIDQPFWEFWWRKSTEDLQRFITRRYADSWERLEGLLNSGANICTTDDHEYWNDYPNTPVPGVWPALSVQGYRRTMRRNCQAFVANMQLSRAVESFTIGNPPQLSVFVADTRMHRSRGRDTFMQPDDMDRLVHWLAELTSPGVLVLGQPLFAPPVSRWSGLFGTDVEIADRNLPGFKQFATLVRALQHAPHDVCVLSGDVHFGRVARVQLDRRDVADSRTLFEVIASPMAQLPGSNGAFDPDDSESRRTFPAIPFEPVPDVPPAPIEWINTVPTKPDDAGRTEEHFMTLAFTDAGNGNVHVRVSAWLVRRSLGADGLPHLAWREEFTLRGRGLDISGARSLLLEQEDIPGALSLLLEQEQDIPGARSLLLEQEETT
jgi:hypothetical protein